MLNMLELEVNIPEKNANMSGWLSECEETQFIFSATKPLCSVRANEPVNLLTAYEDRGN